ncbi:dynamin family protein [Acinetobacter wuhouensis]|uniref:Dynamin-type G domain-containing protein n=1 Tax=Acinetobacter wuhouensis TaxID=1879050 RepID=A0A4Q7AEW5_9GAMM|nr:dynamin family protein [Acinetobacter wuhouensis]RZG43308.1 hypothetical protein EXU28_17575 [Acinetobacter wuhouensis]
MGNVVNTIELLKIKQEVQALLKNGISVFEQIVDLDVLMYLEQDSSFAQQVIAVLNGEYLKLERFETVIAVVGTMKAGKSTMINAIVGREVLPNRNAPMTAIPTLIKHSKGRKQPRLIFTEKARQPVQQLVQDLRKQFKKEQYAQVLESLKLDTDLYLTVERIQRGIKITKKALGEKKIFDFLISMNDLVRIAPQFDLSFPFDQYQDIDQLPIIEVEFVHLKNMKKQYGQLVLLDTPGPNEAGQTHLRSMLLEQLYRASAVLAVMDYTQLKSEADAQVREDIQSIAHTAKNRIYALVNKFDNCDRNGMQKEDVKTFVAGLTGDLVREDQVYPIIAKRAYLANRAKNECFEDGALPDVESNDWVEDFYLEAGLRRESQRTPDRIAEAIDDLWEDSLFSQPLKEVIAESHKKAAFVALDSAIGKLENYIKNFNQMRIQKFREVCQRAYERGVEIDTDDYINTLENHIFNSKLNINIRLLETTAQMLRQHLVFDRTL